ncbi:AsmA family protein [Pararhizobium haloflavum]|uniref:AsmA family protein n=1 Tax=Pararhizobium haloflavum TaxID=2037914 RepID=UPI000C19967B|nr:AsmA-like C-terminal region-containing protein [Pararhizobium haloflavum]
MTLARVFVFIGGLVVVALFAALIGPLFIDWTSYREDFEREASRILGQDVVVHGSADARLLPFPSVTFNDVEVGTRASGDPMMRIERFSMDAELAPFLSGEIRIFDMRIEEPVLNIELAEDGSLDWARRPTAGLPGGTVVFERIRVSDAVVVIDDQQNGRTHRIDDLDTVVSASSLAGPWRLEGTGTVDGESGAFSISTGALDADGSIRIRSRLLPDGHPISLELDGSAEIDDMKPRYAGNFTVQVLDLPEESAPDATPAGTTVRGTGLFEADSKRLRVNEYRLEVGASADPYVVTGEATIDTGEQPEFLLIADGQQINVDRLQSGAEATAEDESQTAPLSAAERIATFRRIVERIPIPDLPGRVSVVLPAVIFGETTLREVSIDARPDGRRWRVDRFAAALPGRTQLEASGELGLGDAFGFHGDLVLASNQPSGFAAWLSDDVNPAIRGLDAAGLEARVDLTERMQRFRDLELVVGEATLNGRFERVVQDRGPSLSFDMAGDRFDLTALRALVDLFAGPDNARRLVGHDVAARLRAERFSAYGVEMGGVDTAFTFQDGILDVDRLEIADLAGAAIDGGGTFSELISDPQGEASFTITAEEPAGFLALVERLGGSGLDLGSLSSNADLFGPAALEVAMRLGSARESASASASGYDLVVGGEAGGSTIDFRAESDAPLGAWRDAPLALDMRLVNPRTERLLAQMGLPVLPFYVGGPGELSATFDGPLFEMANVALNLSTADASLSASGRMRMAQERIEEGAFDVALQAGDLEPYLLLAGVGLPGFGTGLPVDLSAGVALDSEHWRFSALEGTLADNAVSADLTMSREPSPEIEGNLALDTLDLEWLAESLYGQPLRSLQDEGWSTREFPTVAALPFSGEISVRADRAYFGIAEAAERFSADLAYGDGELRFANLAADWLGGTLAGNLTLANRAGSGVLQMQMQLADSFLTRLLGTGEEQSPVSGRADLALSLEGSGKSAEALAGSFTGSGALTLTQLQIAGLRSEAFADILAAADEENFEIEAPAIAELARGAIADGLFAVDQATVPLTIAGGVARASNIVLENPDLSLRGGGSADIAAGTIEASFTAAFDAGEESLPGATPALRLSFSGPVASPQRTIDATEMANFLSLRAYERERRRVERVQAAVLEKQRLRREAAELRATIEARAEARAAEAARREREEAARRAAEEARIAEEAARAERQAAEDAARAAAEAARQAAEEEARQPVPPPAVDVPIPGQFPIAPGEAVEEGAPLAPPQSTPTPAEPTPAPAPQPEPLPQLNFEDLPGVSPDDGLGNL